MCELLCINDDVYTATAVGGIDKVALACLKPERTAKVVDGYRNLAGVDPATCLLAPYCIKVKLDALKGCVVFSEDCFQSLHRVNVV